MKTFNSLNQLFDYSIHCPICKHDRKLEITIGPSSFTYKNMFYKNDVLVIESKFRYSSDNKIDLDLDNDVYSAMTTILLPINVTHIINCITNEYRFEIKKTKFVTDINAIGEAIVEENFWFGFYSGCPEPCDCGVNSTDIEANGVTGKFENVGVEQESIQLIKTKDMFHVSLHPKDNEIQVTKLIRDEKGDLLDNSNVIRLPLANIDFSNEERAVEKIKMMIVFS